jgi:hypothetical protein
MLLPCRAVQLPRLPLKSYAYESVIAPNAVPVIHPLDGARVLVSAPACVSRPSTSYVKLSELPLTACDVIQKSLSTPKETEPATGPADGGRRRMGTAVGQGQVPDRAETAFRLQENSRDGARRHGRSRTCGRTGPIFRVAFNSSESLRAPTRASS